MTKFLKKILIIFLVSAVFIAIIGVWENYAIELNTYTIQSEDVPASFDGYRIAQVSDLHNSLMGENNIKLLSLLREGQPNMIAITGDLIDSRNTNIDIALNFVSEAMKIAPCYYVTGNHEARVSEYNELRDELIKLSVIILENEKIELIESQEKINLMGINDPSFETDYLFGNDESVVMAQLGKLTENEDEYTILLSHRPELFDIYVENDVDLVLSGHAHGGQFRIPFIGGLVAPNQGLFPKYDAGLYKEENTNMIVSRGIGNSIIPLRLNNRPEVILIELEV